MPFFSTIGVNKFILKIGGVYINGFDFGWNEVIGGGIFIKIINYYSLILIKYHYNNFLKIFLLFILIIIIILLLYYFLF